MAFLEASAQHPVAPSLEWGTGNIKVDGKEDGRVVEEYYTSHKPLLCTTIFFFTWDRGKQPGCGWGAPSQALSTKGHACLTLTLSHPL